MSAHRLVANHPPPAALGDRTDADDVLIARSVDRPADFAVIFDRYARDVHRYLRRRIAADVADDLLAETFLVAFERRSRFRAGQLARPWLYGIATNLLRRHRRQEVRALRAWARTGADPVGEPVDTDRIADRVDHAQGLAAALAKMPAGDRDVLLLYAVGELTYAEIAEALRIPVGTVRSRLNRARKRVRTTLEGKS